MSSPGSVRTAAVVSAIALVMFALFVLAFGAALGRPSPQDIPLATVGPARDLTQVTSTFERAAGNGLDLRHYASLAAAESAVNDQDVYGILAASPAGNRLYVASAAGASVEGVLEKIAQQLPPSTLTGVTDLKPLPASDPSGIITFYLTLGATIMGFVTMFQWRANAKGLSEPAWFGLVIAFAVAAGAALAAVAVYALGALQGPFLELWPLVSAQVAIAAAFNSTMLVLIGRWAVLPTWLVFVLLGNASSGGAVAPPLLPEPFQFFSRWLPSGAEQHALHAAVYFRGHEQLEPVIVLAVWLAVTLGALALTMRLRHQSPGLAQ